MNIKRDRRDFLRLSLLGAAGIYALAQLPGCSSFDEYLFEDRSDFQNEVMIVGGGIAGLYLAHKLRSTKTGFRLFEGAAVFGGRIRSNESGDYGASLLAAKDTLANQLIQDLNLETRALDREYIYLPAGMQSLTDALLDRVIGLIPYRNFRLRWKLVAIDRLSNGFQLIFEHPGGQKKFFCRKVALAIPPSQWRGIRGLLELPEMQWAENWLEAMKIENTIKLILPASAAPAGARALTTVAQDAFNFRQIVKKNAGGQAANLEIDVDYLLNSPQSIDYIYGLLRRKLQINFPFQKLSPEQYYDWQQVKLIGGSHFRNFLAVPESVNPHFQIVGDFTAVKSIYRIEGALESAQRAADALL